MLVKLKGPNDVVLPMACRVSRSVRTWLRPRLLRLRPCRQFLQASCGRDCDVDAMGNETLRGDSHARCRLDSDVLQCLQWRGGRSAFARRLLGQGVS